MSFATSNERLPNGPANHWDASADDESTPRSSSVDENQAETMEIPFHGSCPNCHHLHTNRPFTIFTDLTKHARLQCDACQHPILGIGRASTQTTLASVESLLPGQSNNRQSGVLRPSNLQICVNAPPQTSLVDSLTSPDQLDTPAHLSTIAEANTLNGRSRSPSNCQVPVSLSSRRGNSPSPRASLRNNGTLAPEEPREGGKSPIRPRRFTLSALFRRGKARLLSKPGEIKLFGLNIKITRSGRKHLQDSNGPRPNLPDARATPVRHDTDEAQNLGGSAPHPPSPVSSISEEPAEPLGANYDETRPTDFPPPEAEEVQNPTVNLAGSAVDDDEDERAATAKREKIRARRREATLKSDAARKPYCHCRVGCPCLGDGGESDGTSEGHGAPPSIPAPEVPGYFLPNLVAGSSRSSNSQTSHAHARFLSGIGDHIIPSLGNRRQANRLSQDTTTWGSNDSSISLTARRSFPSPSVAMAVPRPRSSGRIAVQNYEDSNPHQGSSRGRESVELPTRESEAAPNGPDPGISDETSNGLLNTFDLRPEQASRQQSSDGASISSGATCIDETLTQLGNEGSTPRPHSHNTVVDNSSNNASGPSPESLSMALANVAERQTDD